MTAAPYRGASPHHAPPPTPAVSAAVAVPEFWRKALKKRAYQLAYRASRERNFHAWPSIDELAIRLLGYALKLYGAAAPGYAEVREICEIALARIIRRGRQLSFEEFLAWKIRRARNNGIRSGASRRDKTRDRDASIREDFAAGASAISLAERHNLSRQQIYNIARRDGGVKRTLSSHHPDEYRNSDLLIESSEVPDRDSSLDIAWILDCWRSSVGRELENWQQHQLRSWANDAGADDGGCDLVDLVRFIEYAGRPEIRDPFRYVQVAVEQRLGKGPEYRQELEVAAGETGRRYAEYGHVRNRRAYLATCARNADPPMTAETRRTGFLDSYRRRHGRLPWEPNGNGSSGIRAEPAEVAELCRQQQPEEVLEPAQEPRRLPRDKVPPVSEQGPCLHPLAALLTSSMSLADVVQVQCSAGCGHRLYSDRGPFACPCHWPAATVARVANVLQVGG